MQPLQYHAAAIALVGAMIVIGTFGPVRGQAQGALPTTVQFPSADSTTTLTGFLYTPRDKRAERAPAVVMMHGRAGPYSINVKDRGPYNASTLSKRHKMWGESWSALGYVAVLVDSFGPRGYPGGFGRHTINERPDAVNEVTVRPLDAYGALAYLRGRSDVAPSTAQPMRRPRTSSARGLSSAAVRLAATSRSSFIPAPATALTIRADKR